MEVSGVISLYHCDECGSHYSSSSMPKLETQMNVDIKGHPTHSRARCPNCGAQRRKRWAWIIPDDHVLDVLREAGVTITVQRARA